MKIITQLSQQQKYIVFIGRSTVFERKEIKDDIFFVKIAGISHILCILNVMRSACNLASFVAVYYLFEGND